MSRPPAADHHGLPAGYVDPGAIAVAKGLARREPDGSVIFDLSPAPSRHDEPASWHAATWQRETVQRQETAAPAPSTGGEPATTATPDQVTEPASAAAAPAAAPAASPAASPAGGAATPPLDELARQLFGPLVARLKAELRLDRERAGLLLDLRQ